MQDCKVILLGTNGWYDTRTGNTVSILVDIPEYYIVLDAGNGIYKLDEYMTEEKPVYLFISHYHLDHTVGIHILPKFRFPKGLFIIGPEDSKNFFKFFIDAPFTTPLKNFSFKTEIIEIPKDFHKLPFKCAILPMTHSITCNGIRIECADKIISYCPDTGYCANALKIAENADLLMTECANAPGNYNPDWPHLNPETAARIAFEANAKQLTLVHFDAEVYPDFESRTAAENIARSVFKNTCAGKDRDIILV